MKVFEAEYEQIKAPQEKQAHPLDTVSLLSRLNFNWINGYIKICKTEQLQQDMHQRLPVADSLDGSNMKSVELFEARCVNSSILRAIGRSFAGPIAFIFAVGLVKSVIGLLASYYSVEFVREFERLNRETDGDRSDMFRLAASIWITSAVGGYIDQNQQFYKSRVIIRVRTRILAAVYAKMLRVGLSAGKHTEGAIMNYL